jgi:hypothetical protein
MRHNFSPQQIEYLLIEFTPESRASIPFQSFIVLRVKGDTDLVPRLMNDREIDERLLSLRRNKNDPIGVAAKTALRMKHFGVQ